ncbi:MAG: hypothetical protein V8Q36_10830 [Anaerotignum sp.]
MEFAYIPESLLVSEDYYNWSLYFVAADAKPAGCFQIPCDRLHSAHEKSGSAVYHHEFRF